MKKLCITIGADVLSASLNDSPAARDFASLLPLTLTLSDYNATEKIGDLPRRLSRDDAPPGFAPSPGDIAYYSPWGNLAIFYRDFDYSPGLIALGRIKTGIDILARRGRIEATIARAGSDSD